VATGVRQASSGISCRGFCKTSNLGPAPTSLGSRHMMLFRAKLPASKKNLRNLINLQACNGKSK
jgi:hypothetical protein